MFSLDLRRVSGKDRIRNQLTLNGHLCCSEGLNVESRRGLDWCKSIRGGGFSFYSQLLYLSSFFKLQPCATIKISLLWTLLTFTYITTSVRSRSPALALTLNVFAGWKGCKSQSHKSTPRTKCFIELFCGNDGFCFLPCFKWFCCCGFVFTRKCISLMHYWK